MNELVEQSIFALSNFEAAQRVAKALASSTMVPKEYQGNISNVLIAMDVSQRTGFSPFAVMQNLHIIHGRPSWSSSFIAGAINSSRRYGPLKIVLSGEGEDRGCHAEAKELASGETVTGIRVTMKMAKAEGWIDKAGSKWKTMPDLMLQYRAISFFGRVYASDILMGLHTEDEILDQPQRFDLEIPASPVIESTVPAKPPVATQEQEKVKIWGSSHNEIPMEVLEAVRELCLSEAVDTTDEKILSFLQEKFKSQMGYQIPARATFDRMFSAILQGVK